MRRFAAPVFGALVLVALVQALWQYTQLPPTVASHFNAAGQPNGWTTRGTHTAVHIFLVLLLAALLEGIARLNRRLPDEYVNIPHREQWLSPENRAATHAWLTDLLRTIGCILLLFFIGLFHQVYRANVAPRPLTLSTGALLFGLVVALTTLLGVTLFRFRKPPP